MPKTCAIISCLKTHADSVSLHTVPKDEIGKQWKDFIFHANRDHSWTETKVLYVCSDHFKQEYLPNSSKKRPKMLAVPTILDGSEIVVPYDSVDRIKPLHLHSVCTKVVIGKSHDAPVVWNFAKSPKPVTEDHSACKREMDVKDYKISCLQKELEECKREIWNLKRRLLRFEERKRKLEDSAGDPLPKRNKNGHDELIQLHITTTQEPSPAIKSFLELIQLIVDRLNHNTCAYPDQIREFAFKLHFYSPKTYECLREDFLKTLPHPRNFTRWIAHIDSSPGFLTSSLDYIANKVKSSSKPVWFNLCFDEMHIRKQILFKGGKFVGFQNNGGIIEDPNDDKEASAALFILATEINGGFRIPIGYVLTNGLPINLMANVIQRSLEKMYETGAKVMGLTFDGLQSNFGSVELLGANLDPYSEDFRPFITHPKCMDNVYVIADPSHMLKLLRNLLKTTDLIDEKTRRISWKYIDQLHHLQLSNGLRAANKLTSRHVNFESQKMKTKLCTQTISNSVGVSINFCRKLGLDGFEDSEGTVEFLKRLDKLFDVLNSRSYGTGYKSPLSRANVEVWTTFFDECKTYLMGLKMVYKGKITPILDTPKKTAIKGLIFTMSSLQLIMRERIMDPEFICLPIYRLGQDMLETFFSLIRSRFGFNNNPNAIQLEMAIRAILCARLGGISSGNCIDQEEISSKISYFHTITALMNEEDVAETDEINDEIIPELNTFVKCIITYIAGYVSKNLFGKLKCEDCMLMLCPCEDELEFSQLIDEKNNGGLITPVSGLVKICNIAEAKLRQHQSRGLENIRQSVIIEDILKDDSLHGLLYCNSDNHEKDYLLKLGLSEYMKIRLYHLAKERTLKINPTTKRNICTKVVHFQGT